VLLAFGCATTKPPLPPPDAIPLVTRVEVEEPFIELWVEDSKEVPAAEAEQALREARAALDGALAGVRTDADPQAFLLVRERAVAVTSARRSQQALATAGIVIGVIAVAVLIVVLVVVLAKSGGGKGGDSGSGGGALPVPPVGGGSGPAPAPPRVAPPPAAPVPRAAPSPGVALPRGGPAPAIPAPPVAAPVAIPAPLAAAGAAPPPGTVRPAPPRSVPGPVQAPPRAAPAPPPPPYPAAGPLSIPPPYPYPPPWPYPAIDVDAYFQLALQLAFEPPAPGPPAAAEPWAAGVVSAPAEAAPATEAPPYEPPADPFPSAARASLDLEQRGFWDQAETILDLALADARTGEILWSATVRAHEDPRDRAAVAALVRSALEKAPFLRPAP
jgi:hypothetical protein